MWHGCFFCVTYPILSCPILGPGFTLLPLGCWFTLGHHWNSSFGQSNLCYSGLELLASRSCVLLVFPAVFSLFFKLLNENWRVWAGGGKKKGNWVPQCVFFLSLWVLVLEPRALHILSLCPTAEPALWFWTQGFSSAFGQPLGVRVRVSWSETSEMWQQS